MRNLTLKDLHNSCLECIGTTGRTIEATWQAIEEAYELGQKSNDEEINRLRKELDHNIRMRNGFVHPVPVIDMANIKEETYSDQNWKAVSDMPEYLKNDAGQLRKERRSVARTHVDPITLMNAEQGENTPILRKGGKTKVVSVKHVAARGVVDAVLSGAELKEVD